MKRTFLGLAASAFLALGFVACDNAADDKDNADSLNQTTTQTTTTSEGTYAAMADTVERNSQSGYYLNPKTGKPYSRLTVDRSTGRITDEAGEPVWRYVDNRNWWVYGYDGSNWNNVGEAKMDNNSVKYKADGDNWVDYDTKWKKEDDEWKMKTEDTKIKVDDDGMKIKTDDQKIKVDEDGVKKDDQ